VFLKEASMKGFRTLLVAMKVFDSDEIEKVQAELKKIETLHVNRDEQMNQLYDKLESEMTLLGATVVEDRLQD
jgi:phospholipid-translocating ATPase